MWVGLLFTFLGVFGSALPGLVVMQLLAYREHLDRQLPFDPGTANGGLPYVWWLMRFGHRRFPDALALRQFGNLSAIFGWVTLAALLTAIFCFIMSKV